MGRKARRHEGTKGARRHEGGKQEFPDFLMFLPSCLPAFLPKPRSAPTMSFTAPAPCAKFVNHVI